MVFLCAKSDDVVIKPGDHIGGIGGGSLLDSDPAKEAAVPWLLPKGDKTWVQRQLEKGQDSDDGPHKKFAAGSLYSILREIERKTTSPTVMTSYGEVQRLNEAGRQHYKFKNQPGEDNFRKVDFVLNSNKKVPSLCHGNLFIPFVSRQHGVGDGALTLTWRLTFDPVGSCLKPTKVYVTASHRIVLQKGKPVKVCWK